MTCSVLSTCMITMWTQLPRVQSFQSSTSKTTTNIKALPNQGSESTNVDQTWKMQGQQCIKNKNQWWWMQRKRMKALVAVDESDGSFYALKWVLENLVNGVSRTSEPDMESVMITVVHVQEPFRYQVYPVGPGGAAFYTTPSIVESVRKAQAENSAAILSRALKMCKDKMVKAETMIPEGDPKDMICQATEQMHYDLLVLGSRGLGRIKRTFLGSASDYCAHHASCPILIVKPPKA